MSNGDVEVEKVGSTNVYFSFPDKESQVKKLQFQSVQAQIVKAEEESKELTQRKRKAEDENPISAERRVKMQKLSSLEAEIASVKDEMKKCSLVDTVKYDRLTQAVDVCKDGISRWTDNLYAVLEWVQKRGNSVSAEEFFTNLGFKGEPSTDF